MNLSHNDPRFDDPDYATDRGGNTIPQHWRKHESGCCCYDCMKREADADSGQKEADNA
jgi:hypothetical protein